jgi:hypothetical protein
MSLLPVRIGAAPPGAAAPGATAPVAVPLGATAPGATAPRRNAVTAPGAVAPGGPCRTPRQRKVPVGLSAASVIHLIVHCCLM